MPVYWAHGKKKNFLKKLKIQEIPSSNVLLISMSALQKSNISVVNQNDMLVKQKSKSLLLIFLTCFEMQTCFTS